MENLIWAFFLWVAVLLLVPFNRIKELWPAAVVGLFLSYIINYGLVNLGYLKFTSYIALWGGVPPLHVLGVAAAGILAVNWLSWNLVDKVVVVLSVGMLLVAAKAVMVSLDAVQLLNGYNYYWSFLINILGVALHVWLSIIVIGKEKVYEGNKSRFINFKR